MKFNQLNCSYISNNKLQYAVYYKKVWYPICCHSIFTYYFNLQRGAYIFGKEVLNIWESI